MSDIVALIPGGGTQISQALEKVGYVVQFDHRYNPARRITKTLAEKQIVKYQLMAQVFFWRRLLVNFPNVHVISPFQDFGGILCNVNGDDFVKALCTEFDETYVLTRADRKEAKEELFKGFPVHVIGI